MAHDCIKDCFHYLLWSQDSLGYVEGFSPAETKECSPLHHRISYPIHLEVELETFVVRFPVLSCSVKWRKLPHGGHFGAAHGCGVWNCLIAGAFQVDSFLVAGLGIVGLLTCDSESLPVAVVDVLGMMRGDVRQ